MYASHLSVSLCTLVCVSLQVLAYVESPKFNQLVLLYPGYKRHGGQYRDRDLLDMVGGNQSHLLARVRNTSPLRMSIALNRYGGRHAIGPEPITIEQGEDGMRPVEPEKGRAGNGNQNSQDTGWSGRVPASVLGRDGQQYIFQNTAFGPYLARKYGNPRLEKPVRRRPGKAVMTSFGGRQGIVRLVSYHRDHAGGHIALWNCDHFIHSPDWSREHHLIAIEFWETPDSYCAAKQPEPTLTDILQYYKLIPRHRATPGERARHAHRVRHGRGALVGLRENQANLSPKGR